VKIKTKLLLDLKVQDLNKDKVNKENMKKKKDNVLMNAIIQVEVVMNADLV
jgi:hypothetical protein